MADHWILLVDPFRNLVHAYRMVLEGHRYLVETARNLEEAVQKLSIRPYSVILTEYFPPFEETYLMIQRAKQTYPETFIVMVTNAIVDEIAYEKLFDAGLDDIIFKPYSPEKILVHLKKGLRQRDLVLRKLELERQPIPGPFDRQFLESNLNAIYFRKCLRQEFKRARRHQHPLSLLVVEVSDRNKVSSPLENFVLELARTFRRNIREEDIIGKDNGSLGILLPETGHIGSQAVVKRLSDLVQTHIPFQTDKSMKPLMQSFSIHSFSYPEAFGIPQRLKGVVDEVDKEYPRR
jgi:PleD family two-component response regulator